MKTRLFIIIALGISLGAVTIIGITGITGEVTLEVNECKQSYLHYYVEPYIKDYLECSFMSPCGVAANIILHNAQVDVLSCLCQNMENNDSLIVDYYNDEMTRFEHELESDDSDFICTDGAKPILRQ